MLDPAFLFSQHSLGDFADCPRRFYLRYVARQAWPLVETGPEGMDALQYQAYLRRGATLHRWIERYWLGIGHAPGVDSRQSTVPEDDAELQLWWSRFLATDFSGLPSARLPELALAAAVGPHRLYARFDLLAVDPAPAPGGAEAVIVDWKTLRGENPPRLAFLRRRMQTRIYLYVLVEAGAAYNGGAPLEPEQCGMRYWLANFPEQPWVEVAYSAAEHEDNRRWLRALADDAAGREGEDQFPKTGDERKCKYCAYRTLCHRRGAPGGELPDEEDAAALDADSAPELEY
jgi:hypothetical protein